MTPSLTKTLGKITSRLAGAEDEKPGFPLQQSYTAAAPWPDGRPRGVVALNEMRAADARWNAQRLRLIPNGGQGARAAALEQIG